MLTSPNADPAFRKNGFSNWKKAMEKKKGFQKHESSDSHMEVVARSITAPATVINNYSPKWSWLAVHIYRTASPDVIGSCN